MVRKIFFVFAFAAPVLIGLAALRWPGALLQPAGLSDAWQEDWEAAKADRW